MQGISFSDRLAGRFDGMIRLTDIAQLQQAVENRDGWFLLEPLANWPDHAVSGVEASHHLATLVDEILKVENGVWTTMVYAQNRTEPDIIKVFHPKRAGCGCGPGLKIKPWWVFTRIPPEPVPAWEEPEICSKVNGLFSWFRKGA